MGTAKTFAHYYVVCNVFNSDYAMGFMGILKYLSKAIQTGLVVHVKVNNVITPIVYLGL